MFLRKRGIRRTLQRISEETGDAFLRRLTGRSRYEQFFDEQQRTSALALDVAPGNPSIGVLISIIMPVCDPEPRWLRAAIDSVKAQLHSNWQLCIVDDASQDPAVLRLLEVAHREDERVQVLYNSERLGISRTSNRALEIAQGQYVALLDHDDELTPDALMHVSRAAGLSSFDILYSDEDKIDVRGRLRDPTFKPGRSREFLYSCMYFGHLTVYRREFINMLGRFEPELDGSQDYDLALRAEARADRVLHLPLVLYHWRMAAGSAANLDEDAKPWAYEAGRRALQAEIGRQAPGAQVVDGVGRGHARVIRPSKPGTKVSVLYCDCCIEPDRDSEDAGGVIEWISMEGLSENGDDAEPLSIGARWNRGAERAIGDVLIFMDGVRPARQASGIDGWEELASQVLRDRVGAVGARIHNRQGALVHMGTVLGGSEVVRTRVPGLRSDEPGHLALAQSLREVSAVTGGCFAMSRELLASFGGFNVSYRTTLHDVDLCMRLRARGYRVLYDPYVACGLLETHVVPLSPEDLRGRAVVSRDVLKTPSRMDLSRFAELWREELSHLDPYSNPNFHSRGAIFHPAYRPIDFG